MDPTQRDERVALAVRAVRAVRAVKAATSSGRAVPVAGWAALATGFAATAVSTSTPARVLTDASAPTQTPHATETAHPAGTETTTTPEPGGSVSAEATGEHGSATATTSLEGPGSASLASSYRMRADDHEGSGPGSGHGAGGDVAPEGDITVQEFETAVVTEDGEGNLTVETFTHVVVQYQGTTYVSDGHTVASVDPRSGQDAVVHQTSEVVVHENRDGSYSVSIDAHSSVEVVPDTDGHFDATLVQSESTTLEDRHHDNHDPGLEINQGETADNHSGNPVDIVQVESAGRAADQVQNASGRGGGTITQGQRAGSESTQTQNADGALGDGIKQTQGAGRGSDQVQNADGRLGGPISQGQSAGRGSDQVQNADGRLGAGSPPAPPASPGEHSSGGAETAAAGAAVLAPIGAAAGLPSELSHPLLSSERLADVDASAPLLPPGPDPLQPTASHVASVQPGPHFQVDPPFGATASSAVPTHFDTVPAAPFHAATGDATAQRPSEPITGHSDAVAVPTPDTELVRQHEESHEHPASSSHDSSGTAPPEHTDHVGHTDHT